jgi:hypothetical protein
MLAAVGGYAMQCTILVFDDENVLLASDAQLQPALDQLFLAHFAQTIGVACRTVEISECYQLHCRSLYALPLLKHSILT